MPLQISHIDSGVQNDGPRQPVQAVKAMYKIRYIHSNYFLDESQLF
jgi:hypothetical protein